MTRRIKVPTYTTVVMDAMRRADDFLTARQIRGLTGLRGNNVSAALHHLRRHKAIDCMESGGQLWWYVVPDSDDRSRVCDERAPESRPRRQKAVRP